jgi:transcriptional regulator GlxA family with amidase domain
MRPADVAVAVGFHDQSHLNRHFKRMLATTPARYAGGRRSAS